MKRALAVAAALACAACGTPPLRKLPVGPGAPSADAADVLGQATAACRAVRTLTARDRRNRFGGWSASARAPSCWVSAPASARLEALAPFGPPVFIIVAAGDDATLLLPRDERVLEHGRPDAVLEAIVGVPLGAADLQATLTGCARPFAGVQGRQIGDWRIANPVGNGAGDDEEWYLQLDAMAVWRLVTTVHRSTTRPWRAEYGDFRDGLPRSVRIASEDPKFDVRLVLSQVEINAVLGPDVFKVQIPRTATPITLQELQRSGPFGAAPSHGR